TVGLDPVQTADMRGLVRGLVGRTVLLSTHVLSEASALCSRVVILERGRVVAEDTATGLAHRVEGAARLTVRVDGPRADVRAALAALAGVVGVDEQPADGEGGAVSVVRAAEPQPVRRAVAAAVVGRGWTLLEVHLAAPTLEDLFLRLVGPTER